MQSKICKTCNIELDLSEFKFIKKDKCYLNNCKKCCYSKSNKKLSKETSKKWYEKNKKLSKVKRLIYNEINKDKILTYSSEYYKNNKEKQLKSGYERHKLRLLNDPIYKLKNKMRTTLKNSFRHTKIKKTKSTNKVLGCTIEEFKIYLESKFESWMSWDNRGLYNGELNFGWDIDHIIPISTAKTEEDVIRLNHYTNLQPLCSKINRNIKKDKLF